MNTIQDNLRLLSIFNYVLAGLIGLFSCIPIIHIILGIVFLLAPEKMCDGNCDDAPPALIGWLFIGIGAFIMLTGWTLAIFVALTGRFIAKLSHYKFCLAVAAASCIFMPFGTVLGVFTLITLTKAEVQALFRGSSR